MVTSKFRSKGKDWHEIYQLCLEFKSEIDTFAEYKKLDSTHDLLHISDLLDTLLNTLEEQKLDKIGE